MKKVIFFILLLFFVFFNTALGAEIPSNFTYRGIKVVYSQTSKQYSATIKSSIALSSPTVAGIKSAIDGIIGMPATQFGVYLVKASYSPKINLSYKVKSEDAGAIYSLRIVKYSKGSSAEKSLSFSFVKSEKVVSVLIDSLSPNECVKAYAMRLNKAMEAYGQKIEHTICPMSAPIPILYTVNASDYRKVVASGKVVARNNDEYILRISAFKEMPAGIVGVPQLIQESSQVRKGASEFSIATKEPFKTGRYAISVSVYDKKTGAINSSRKETVSIINPNESSQFVPNKGALVPECTREKSIINKQVPIAKAMKLASTIGAQVGLPPEFIIGIAAHESKVNKDVGEKFYVENCYQYAEDTDERNHCVEYYNILQSVNLGRKFAPASAPKWATYADGVNGGAMGISQFKPLTWRDAVNDQNGLNNVAILLEPNWANMSPWNPCVGMIVSASHLAYLKKFVQREYPSVTSEECLHKYITQIYYSGRVYENSEASCGISDPDSYSKRSYFKRNCFKAIYNGTFPDSECYGTDYDYSIYYTAKDVGEAVGIYKKK